ncbi:EpsG family protein [Thalassotalea fonticola]|uniref:EpsG family protein n=1 Tax=Thalassotalea fonticola TaxID=3065649 RepID=A0ABZ0GTJ0_9GAMM|nr:EpsG family protein [Colwelliaceae bacterium S1-1]
MLPYAINLYLSTVFLLIANNQKNIQIRIFCYLLSGLSLVFLISMRFFTVGTDTRNYVTKFAKQPADSLLGENEVGFEFLMLVAKQFSEEYFVFLFFVALVFVTCCLTIIIRNIKSYEVGLFVFITMGFYSFIFNGTRQGLALSVFMVSLPYLVNRNLFKYIVVIVCASLFHKSVLITIPLYFFTSKFCSYKKIITIFFSSFVLLLLFEQIIVFATLFDEKYSGYSLQHNSGGYYITGLNLLICLSLIFIKKFIRYEKEIYNQFLTMYVIGTAISLVAVLSGTNASGFLRLSLYFNVSLVFLVPIVFRNIRTELNKLIFSFLFVFFFSAYYFVTTSTFSNLAPYIFNPILF